MTRGNARWPAVCACGKEYSEDRWKTLRYVGIFDQDDGPALEMRVCVCGSTISVASNEKRERR